MKNYVIWSFLTQQHELRCKIETISISAILLKYNPTMGHLCSNVIYKPWVTQLAVRCIRNLLHTGPNIAQPSILLSATIGVLDNAKINRYWYWGYWELGFVSNSVRKQRAAFYVSFDGSDIKRGLSLKLFQWDRYPPLEMVQNVQNWQNEYWWCV